MQHMFGLFFTFLYVTIFSSFSLAQTNDQLVSNSVSHLRYTQSVYEPTVKLDISTTQEKNDPAVVHVSETVDNKDMRFNLNDPFYKYDVITISDAITNAFVNCDDIKFCQKIISDIGIQKGGFIRLDNAMKQRIDKIIRDNKNIITIRTEAAVSSASNTIRMTNKLGGQCAFIGSVGRDAMGSAIYKRLSDLKIKSHISFNDVESSVVYIFKDEEGEKFMASYIGSSGNTSEAIPYDEIIRSKVLMIEGYAWNRGKKARAAMQTAIKFAKVSGVKTALGLGSTSIIKKNVHDMHSMLQYFDILFGTKDEFLALLNNCNAATDEEIAEIAKKLNAISVITMGERGAMIVYQDSIYNIPAEKVNQVVCTVGAGDAFAGGFLYGYTHNMSLEESGKIGAHVAAKIVQIESTTLD